MVAVLEGEAGKDSPLRASSQKTDPKGGQRIEGMSFLAQHPALVMLHTVRVPSSH